MLANAQSASLCSGGKLDDNNPWIEWFGLYDPPIALTAQGALNPQVVDATTTELLNQHITTSASPASSPTMFVPVTAASLRSGPSSMTAVWPKPSFTPSHDPGASQVGRPDLPLGPSRSNQDRVLSSSPSGSSGLALDNYLHLPSASSPLPSANLGALISSLFGGNSQASDTREPQALNDMNPAILNGGFVTISDSHETHSHLSLPVPTIDRPIMTAGSQLVTIGGAIYSIDTTRNLLLALTNDPNHPDITNKNSNLLLNAPSTIVLPQATDGTPTSITIGEQVLNAPFPSKVVVAGVTISAGGPAVVSSNVIYTINTAGDLVVMPFIGSDTVSFVPPLQTVTVDGETFITDPSGVIDTHGSAIMNPATVVDTASETLEVVGSQTVTLGNVDASGINVSVFEGKVGRMGMDWWRVVVLLALGVVIVGLF